jgi:hypothetical protein
MRDKERISPCGETTLRAKRRAPRAYRQLRSRPSHPPCVCALPTVSPTGDGCAPGAPWCLSRRSYLRPSPAALHGYRAPRREDKSETEATVCCTARFLPGKLPGFLWAKVETTFVHFDTASQVKSRQVFVTASQVFELLLICHRRMSKVQPSRLLTVHVHVPCVNRTEETEILNAADGPTPRLEGVTPSEGVTPPQLQYYRYRAAA